MVWDALFKRNLAIDRTILLAHGRGWFSSPVKHPYQSCMNSLVSLQGDQRSNNSTVHGPLASGGRENKFCGTLDTTTGNVNCYILSSSTSKSSTMLPDSWQHSPDGIQSTMQYSGIISHPSLFSIPYRPISPSFLSWFTSRSVFKFRTNFKG